MKLHPFARGLTIAAALGVVLTTAAQEPGDPGAEPAGDPNAGVNDPAGNQAGNPAETGDTGATPARVPVAQPYLPLTVDHFNYLDEDLDGALSEAELSEDPTLEDHFEEMDADRNRAIDPTEFRGYRPTRPAGEAGDDLSR